MLTANQLKGLRVLVIDGSREMRTMLRETLSEAQIKNIIVAPHASSAVEAIRAEPFNLILSDYDLGSGTDGQQLLEFLRQERLMPPGGLFFIISADSTINRVASAAEMLPDGYLVKPLTSEQLLSRIEEALERHVELRPMYEAVHAGRFAEGLAHCEALERAGSRFRVELMRHISKCQSGLGRWDDALQTYRRALKVRSSMTWASLGVARCCLVMGDIAVARQRLHTILQERPYHAGAYDLLIELCERTGDVNSALKIATRAAEHIPSLLRTRRLAEIAYLAGELETADTALTKVVKQTAKSITRNSRNSALLAQVCLALGDPQRAMHLIAKEVSDWPSDPRTQALAAAIDVQAWTALGRPAEAETAGRRVAASLDIDAEPRIRLLIAKAALSMGMTEQGLKVLDEAVAAAEQVSSAEGASTRALACKVFVDAGMPERAGELIVDRFAQAEQDAETAVRTLRGGGFDEAIAMVNATLPKARDHTGVLTAAVEVYLMTMRVKGVRPELLAKVQTLLTRLRVRGTADPQKLDMMDSYLRKLETTTAVRVAEPLAVTS
ncbi:MAG: response regulator [Burkholderiales bacterium]|nr:response regulator [Burkholderiales bacterium]